MNTEESDCENPRRDDSIIYNDPSDSEYSESEPDAHSNISSKESSDLQEAFSEFSEDMESIEETNFESNFSKDSCGENKDWYPFKKKEIMIGCILAGCTRSLMSRKTYDHIRLVLRLCNIDLPSWRTVQSAKAKLQKYTYCRVQKSKLGNPLVSKFVEFYPELSNGKNIYKLSQSEKWLHQFPRNLRAQMISVGGKQFYIYEPVQLIDGNVVVPVFFYTKGGKIYAKACKLNVSIDSSEDVNISICWNLDFFSPDTTEIFGEDFWRPYNEILFSDRILLATKCRNILHEITSEGKEIIQLPNPWRVKAEGKIIRHIPLNFYSDDTSGNVSKQWNKHISIFMSLAGLPPKLSNQEFNTLFVATSNIATALELAAPVCDELNNLSLSGFTAFYYSLQEHVLVLPVVLLFMADSPMHAEITSTMQPNVSLQPCRICNLRAENKKEKATGTYVYNFIGCKPNGYNVIYFPLYVQQDLRCWTATKNSAYKTWELFQQGAPKNQIHLSITKLGVKDMLNQKVMKVIQEDQDTRLVFNIKKLHEERKQQLFNPFFELKGFDGHKDTPVEVLHVVLLGILKYLYPNKKEELIARLQTFDTNNLNIQPIKAKYLIQHYSSLVGKDFKVLIQAAPFRKIWTSLCHLYIKKYTAKITYFTQDFLLKLISASAQWVNKPKFHMLIHLSQSIAQFGPASLFATEKFESYNGVVRQASIHSNRQSPSRDIANNFLNYSALRYCFSGGYIQTESSRPNISPSYQVKNLLLNTPSIQNLLGLDSQTFKQKPRFPVFKNSSQSDADCYNNAPSEIKAINPELDWLKILSFELDEHQNIKANSFISVKSQEITQNNFIAYIIGIWGAKNLLQQKIYLQCLRCEILEMDTFYGMRTLKKLNREEFISAKTVISGINVQHHCAGAKCLIRRTLPRRLERQETDMTLKEVHHNFNFNLYVINTASLRSQDEHHSQARIPLPPIQPLDVLNAVHNGLSEWKKGKNSKGKNKAPESMSSIDPSLA
ncbi:hypothetical protein BY996DRAFT_6431741 [Phakopsora pachyrhizi]|nr:hypothetical protein BY996DRAFT_6431741 [Phakopsora pachyrhizi]